MSQSFNIILHHSEYLYPIIVILGLLVGSFLNVVIYRLPKILDNEWKHQAETILELPLSERPKLSLSTPNSTCPHCQHAIRPWENIPVISYLFLRGKCSSCHAPISMRYPIIELVCAVLSITVVTTLGPNGAGLTALLLTWALIALTMIDFDTQLLPDSITLPLLWTGLIANSQGLFTSLEQAVWGAIAGYMSLWLVYQGFKITTGKEGMGYGDFKLLAALGAWMGWQMLPIIILLSSVVGAIIGISLVLIKGRDKNIPIPFGPYLAIAGWIALLWGQDILHWWLRYNGL